MNRTRAIPATGLFAIRTTGLLGVRTVGPSSVPATESGIGRLTTQRATTHEPTTDEFASERHTRGIRQ